MKRFTAFFVAFSAPALAQSPVPPEQVVAVMNLDLNGDAYLDRVVLVEADGRGPDGHLLIYLSKSDFDLHYYGRLGETVWISQNHGEPRLGRNAAGSLTVTSENIAIGRNRWEQTLTLAWRDDAVRVVGYDYVHYDTLDLENSGSCSLNLLSGRGVITDHEDEELKVVFDLRAAPVEAWDSQAALEICFDP